MERVEKDNRALGLQNTELRNQLQELKTENLEVGAGGCFGVEGLGFRV